VLEAAEQNAYGKSFSEFNAEIKADPELEETLSLPGGGLGIGGPRAQFCDIPPGVESIDRVLEHAPVAGLIAVHDESVTGLVLISGVYDLPQYVADSTSSRARKMVVRSLMEETGGKTEALTARSLLSFPGKIKAATLIINGEKDDLTDPNQARRLADAIVSHGGKAHAIIYPDYGHRIPVSVRNREIDPFIEELIGK
jgi:pimeloyl-ACP methyl ester carboxylesterase